MFYDVFWGSEAALRAGVYCRYRFFQLDARAKCCETSIVSCRAVAVADENPEVPS
jgi:hypothetical protein